MSLDVHLMGGEIECPHCKHCDSCGGSRKTQEFIFSANITHNLNKMAGEAGIYKHLWRPEEMGITHASDLIKPLSAGLKLMRSDPDRFKKYDSPNGWGLYENFVPWVASYLKACEEHPDAKVIVSR